MSDSFSRKPEYGGFLPLELNNSGELYAKYEPHVMRFNSIQAGFSYLFNALPIRKIFLPYYYCPSTIEAIRRTGIEVCFYHIEDTLLPTNLVDEEGCGFLLVNYFGVMTEAINRVAKEFANSIVLIDRAHSFFDEPIMEERIYNFYSARKFFGVPDGAYLIGREIDERESHFSLSSDYSGYLLTTYEEGTNKAYQLKKQSDLFISEHHAGMSLLAHGLLCNVNYAKVENARRKNYETLYGLLKEKNELVLPETCVPYHYPLQIRHIGSGIKESVIHQRIYVPTLWSGTDLQREGSDFELSMMEDSVFLPVDQRYSPEDMEYIANEVLSRSQT